LKLLQETATGKQITLEDTGICKYFLNRTPIAQEIGEQILKSGTASD
jgi:hypothetical protein